MLSFSDDGRNMPRSVIEEVGCFSLKSYHGLIPVLGNVQTTQKGQSMKVKTPISIHIKSNGCPKIHAVTKADGYRAKDLQAMLWDYLLRSRPTCHGIRRTVIDIARASLVFHFFCIILRLHR